jgi:hypothetical protein
MIKWAARDTKSRKIIDNYNKIKENFLIVMHKSHKIWKEMWADRSVCVWHFSCSHKYLQLKWNKNERALDIFTKKRAREISNKIITNMSRLFIDIWSKSLMCNQFCVPGHCHCHFVHRKSEATCVFVCAKEGMREKC